MLNSPELAPVSATQNLLSQPALGPASRVQAMAPRKPGVMKAPTTQARTRPFAGMSVRTTAQAIGTAIARSSKATAVATSNELRIALRYRSVVKAVTKFAKVSPAPDGDWSALSTSHSIG